MERRGTADGETAWVITDNGLGFDSTKVNRVARHMGISAFRELAVRASGDWHVESTPGIGTVVTTWLPGAAPIDATDVSKLGQMT